jgi:hypothetical protein
MWLKMTKTSELIQGFVALLLIGGDIAMHILKVPADGFDSAVAIIIAVYFGGKVVQTVQSGQSQNTSTTAVTSAQAQPMAQPVAQITPAVPLATASVTSSPAMSSGQSTGATLPPVDGTAGPIASALATPAVASVTAGAGPAVPTA